MTDIYILMVSDDNFAFLLKQSLFSIFNSNKESKIHVFIVNDGIKDGIWGEIVELAIQFDNEIIALHAPKLEEVKLSGAYNITTYYRLLAAEMLPYNLNKVLYLDCDILTLGNLDELFCIDMGNNLVAGVLDIQGKKTKKQIGLQEHDIYINAGMLLINLDLWRKENIQKQCFSWLEHMGNTVPFNDQGIINHICKTRIKVLPPKYNTMWAYESFSCRQLKKHICTNPFYSDAEISEAKKHPIILHFAGYPFLRPWYKHNLCKHTDAFKQNCTKSGTIYENKALPKDVKLYLRMCMHMMPFNLRFALYHYIGW